MVFPRSHTPAKNTQKGKTMKKNTSISIQEMLEHMSTEALDQMLHTELSKKPLDQNAVRLILRVLREREKDIPARITPTIQKAWERYEENLHRLEQREIHLQKQKKIFRKILSTAAVFLLLLLFLVPQRTEANTVWDRFARWSNEILEFFTPENPASGPLSYGFQTENHDLQRIYDDLVRLGVNNPQVPTWIPETLTLDEYKTEERPSNTRLYSYFTDGSSNLTLVIDIYKSDVSRKFQKDKNAVEYKEINGNIFYFIKNLEATTIIWGNENTECFLVVDCQEEIQERIINSIFTTEES